MKKLSLINKIKILCVAFFSFGIICGFIFFNISPKKEKCREEFVVSQGDTLWDIADTYTDSEYDIRYTIYRIKEINNMDSPTLHPGEVILVPVYAK